MAGVVFRFCTLPDHFDGEESKLAVDEYSSSYQNPQIQYHNLIHACYALNTPLSTSCTVTYRDLPYLDLLKLK